MPWQSKVYLLSLLLISVIVLIAGCASTESRWKDTETIDSITAYDDFLKRYPQGKFADDARLRLETLYLQKAKDTNTILSYEEFIRLYPQGKSTDDARFALDRLKKQLSAIENAAREVLPTDAKVLVTSASRYPKKADFIISAHLLEGHSTDDDSPYIRGDYGTHEKLTRLVRYRCAKVLKAIFAGDKFPDAGTIIIVARHGVRQTTGGLSSSGTDVAKAIYQISLPMDEAKKHNWFALSEDKVMELWSIDNNIIPSLRFISSPEQTTGGYIR